MLISIRNINLIVNLKKAKEKDCRYFPVLKKKKPPCIGSMPCPLITGSIGRSNGQVPTSGFFSGQRKM
jgi:hypothetical protein